MKDGMSVVFGDKKNRSQLTAYLEQLFDSDVSLWGRQSEENAEIQPSCF